MRNPRANRRRWLLPVLAAACLAAASGAVALDEVTDPYWDWRDEVGRGEFQYDDSEDRPWIETETEVLALPAEDELYELRLDLLPPDFRLSVDRARITVGEEDRVVRLWLWVRNGQGNESGTYEGFRCETGEYKIYAYANPRRDPPVRVAERARWRPAKPGSRQTYRWELLRDYFCGIRGTRTAREIGAAMTGEFKRETFLSQ
jgi:hypothetical protein